MTVSGTKVYDAATSVAAAQLSVSGALAGEVVLLSAGTATLNADGTITFTPDAGFNGAVDFGYTISDGTATDTANVRVVIDDVNDPPVAQDN